MNKSLTKLSFILIFSRNIEKSTSFYTTILDLKVIRQSKNQIELEDLSKTKFILKQSENEAFCSTGYSPIINLSVDSVDFIKEKLSRFDFKIDSYIDDEELGKILCFRGPDNIMFSVNEGDMENSDVESDGEDEENSETVKDLLRKIKF